MKKHNTIILFSLLVLLMAVAFPAHAQIAGKDKPYELPASSLKQLFKNQSEIRREVSGLQSRLDKITKRQDDIMAQLETLLAEIKKTQVWVRRN